MKTLRAILNLLLCVCLLSGCAAGDVIIAAAEKLEAEEASAPKPSGEAVPPAQKPTSEAAPPTQEPAPEPAVAAPGETGAFEERTVGDYVIRTNGAEATILRYTGAATALTIPDTFEGAAVTGIGEYAFSDCASLADVTIPDSVTEIGERAFSYCESLASITLPDNVRAIGVFAFAYCESLRSVMIPKSVMHIGDGAFNACRSLTAIIVKSENQYYTCDNGVLFSRDGTLLHTYLPTNPARSYMIPDGVTTIGYGAFAWCQSLVSVTVPYSVTTIREDAFIKCDFLTTITIPGNVTTIGDRAFAYCYSLAGFTIPESVTAIGYGAFLNCTSLTGITVSPGNPHYMFDHGALLSRDGKLLHTYLPANAASTYTIPDSVTAIANEAFKWCDPLTDVTLHNGVTSIGYEAFYACRSLASITIPDSVTAIGVMAFEQCPALTIHTPANSVAHRYAEENGIPFQLN